MKITPRELDRDVQAAADRGDVIEAIKLLRERTGLGLKEAKDAIDAYLRDEPMSAAVGETTIPVAAISALHEGKLIAGG